MCKNYFFPIIQFIFFIGCFNISAQVLEAKLLEIEFKPDGNPESLTRSNDGFYFTSGDDQLWYSDGTADGTYLIKDFKSGYHNEIMGITPLNDRVFLSAKDGVLADYQLWMSDGTEGGTISLTNRNVPTSEDDMIRDIVSFNGLVFFSAFDEVQGNELWVSDGTPEGTRVFKDIVEGAAGSFPVNFFIHNNKLFFEAYTEDFGQELWVSDGTVEGTSLFKDINPGMENGLGNSNYIGHGNNFYFYATDGIHGRELWKSDGTPTGTVQVKDINPGTTSSSLTLEGVILNDQLVFAANDGTHGKELWISDGSENGTSLLVDLNTLISGGSTSDFPIVASNSAVFFVGYHQPSSKFGVWASNGTPEGTIYLGAGSPNTFVVSASGDSVMYFATGPNNSSVLWSSDGTLQGTKVISDIVQPGTSSIHDVSFLLVNDLIYFSGKNEKNGVELWVSNGTTPGTFLFKDIDTSGGARPSSITGVGDNLFFASTGLGYRILGVSDGTVDGSNRINVITEGRGTADKASFVNFDDRLIFAGYDSEHGYELWASDGTVNGTTLIKDIHTGTGSSLEHQGDKESLTKVGDKLFFSANDGIHGPELWTSDGTELGTYLIKDINTGSGGTLPKFAGSYPSSFNSYNGLVYFVARDAVGNGLFRTDGTSSGTFKLDINDQLSKTVVVNGKLLVHSTYNIYVTDGSTEGTQHLLNVGDGCCDSGIKDGVINNDSYYFIATSAISSRKAIYKSNGTPEGTVLLFDAANHTTPSVNIEEIVACGGFVYFGVNLSQNFDAASHEIWRTDGTPEGTILVSSSESSFDTFYGLHCLNNSLYFLDHYNQKNIWVTNGDPNEVFKFDINVINTNPPATFRIQELGSMGNSLFFNADSNLSGAELHVSIPSKMQPGVQFADSDGDNIADFFDMCADTPAGEAVNEVGCSESQLDDDEDGVPNSIDLCPGTKMNDVVDENGCSNEQVADDDNDGVVNAYDLCPGTAAGATVDTDGCSEGQLDEDGDGVMNDADICPGTEANLQVDTHGCPVIFTLPGDNFTVRTIGETCIDKNNGQIIIEADEPLNYIASVGGIDYNFTSSTTIGNLTPGSYSLCISVREYSEFSQCFNLTIEELTVLTGKSSTVLEGSHLKESFEILSGTAPYSVQINGQEVLNTTETSFTLEINDGDHVQITSQYDCEGYFEKTISTKKVALTYPNPTNRDVRVFVPGLTTKVQVELYNSQLQLLEKAFYESKQGEIEISLLKYPAGIYFLKIGQADSIYFKLVKL